MLAVVGTKCTGTGVSVTEGASSQDQPSMERKVMCGEV